MIIKDYLRPAAVLILAATQVPEMIRDYSFNSCVGEAMNYIADVPLYSDKVMRRGEAVARCRGWG